jgi:hypothetical protein
VFRRRPANGQTRRRHECRRGTQECVRHNGFNTLSGRHKN